MAAKNHLFYKTLLGVKFDKDAVYSFGKLYNVLVVDDGV